MVPAKSPPLTYSSSPVQAGRPSRLALTKFIALKAAMIVSRASSPLSPAWVNSRRENWLSGKMPTSSANMQKISRIISWFISCRRSSLPQSGLALVSAS